MTISNNIPKIENKDLSPFLIHITDPLLIKKISGYLNDKDFAILKRTCQFLNTHCNFDERKIRYIKNVVGLLDFENIFRSEIQGQENSVKKNELYFIYLLARIPDKILEKLVDDFYPTPYIRYLCKIVQVAKNVIVNPLNGYQSGYKPESAKINFNTALLEASSNLKSIKKKHDKASSVHFNFVIEKTFNIDSMDIVETFEANIFYIYEEFLKNQNTDLIEKYRNFLEQHEKFDKRTCNDQQKATQTTKINNSNDLNKIIELIKIGAIKQAIENVEKKDIEDRAQKYQDFSQQVVYKSNCKHTQEITQSTNIDKSNDLDTIIELIKIGAIKEALKRLKTKESILAFIICALASKGEISSIEYILKNIDIEKDCLIYKQTIYNEIAIAYAKKKNIDTSISYLEKNGQRHSGQLDYQISLGNLVSLVEPQILFREYQYRITAYIESGEIDTAFEILNIFQKKAMETSVLPYLRRIFIAYLQAGDVQQAFQITEKFKLDLYQITEEPFFHCLKYIAMVYQKQGSIDQTPQDIFQEKIILEKKQVSLSLYLSNLPPYSKKVENILNHKDFQQEIDSAYRKYYLEGHLKNDRNDKLSESYYIIEKNNINRALQDIENQSTLITTVNLSNLFGYIAIAYLEQGKIEQARDIIQKNINEDKKKEYLLYISVVEEYLKAFTVSVKQTQFQGEYLQATLEQLACSQISGNYRTDPTLEITGETYQQQIAVAFSLMNAKKANFSKAFQHLFHIHWENGYQKISEQIDKGSIDGVEEILDRYFNPLLEEYISDNTTFFKNNIQSYKEKSYRMICKYLIMEQKYTDSIPFMKKLFDHIFEDSQNDKDNGTKHNKTRDHKYFLLDYENALVESTMNLNKYLPYSMGLLMLREEYKQSPISTFALSEHEEIHKAADRLFKNSCSREDLDKLQNLQLNRVLSEEEKRSYDRFITLAEEDKIKEAHEILDKMYAQYIERLVDDSSNPTPIGK